MTTTLFQPLILRALKFYIAIHEALYNSGGISLPWNCESVLKSRTHHPTEQPPTEQEPTTIGLIITNTTHALNLHHLTCRKSAGKLSNHWSSKRKSWIHLPSSFHLFNTRNKKIKPYIHFACSFCSATPGAKRKIHLLH